MVFYVFVTFSHGKVIMGVRLTLKTLFYTHRPARTVMMEVSMPFSSIANVYLRTVTLQTSSLFLCYGSITSIS